MQIGDDDDDGDVARDRERGELFACACLIQTIFDESEICLCL